MIKIITKEELKNEQYLNCSNTWMEGKDPSEGILETTYMYIGNDKRHGSPKSYAQGYWAGIGERKKSKRTHDSCTRCLNMPPIMAWAPNSSANLKPLRKRKGGDKECG